MKLKLRFIAAFLLFFAFSCKKASVNNSSLSNEFPVFDPSVLVAKNFFDANIKELQFIGSPDARQKLKKVPIWEKAYLAYKNNREIVVVPLHFEENMTFTTSSDSSQKLSLSKQSKLLIYKDNSTTKVEVVTYIPDNNKIEDDLVGFSGVIIVEDWAGNSISKLVVKNNITYKLVKKPSLSSNKITADGGCTVIQWYLCDLNENGTTSNCVYAFTEYIGSCNEGLEPCYDNCGGAYIEYDEVAITKRANYTNNLVLIHNSSGGGTCNSLQILYARFHRNHSEKDYISACYFIRADVTGNNQGATVTINQHITTPLSKTVVTIKTTGLIKWPDNRFLEIDDTVSVTMAQLSWY